MDDPTHRLETAGGNAPSLFCVNIQQLKAYAVDFAAFEKVAFSHCT